MTAGLNAELVEALDETAEALVVSRNRLVEFAVAAYLSRIDLTPPTPTKEKNP